MSEENKEKVSPNTFSLGGTVWGLYRNHKPYMEQPAQKWINYYKEKMNTNKVSIKSFRNWLDRIAKISIMVVGGKEKELQDKDKEMMKEYLE